MASSTPTDHESAARRERSWKAIRPTRDCSRTAAPSPTSSSRERWRARPEAPEREGTTRTTSESRARCAEPRQCRKLTESSRSSASARRVLSPGRAPERIASSQSYEESETPPPWKAWP
eukprot:scaffold85792_cov62-Phaeocystis_antarctica.AAC.2